MIVVHLDRVLEHFNTNTNQLAKNINESQETLRRFRQNLGVRLNRTIIEKICTFFQIDFTTFIALEGEEPKEINKIPLKKGHSFILYCNLRSILHNKGMSIYDLAVSIDRNYELVRRLANNTTERLPIDLIYLIIQVLDISLDELFRLHKTNKNILQKDEKIEHYQSKTELIVDLKDILQRKEITLQELAKNTGLGYQNLLRFQNNEMKRLPVDMIEILCDYLNVSIDTLLKTRKFSD